MGSDAPPAQEPTVVTTLPEQVTVPKPETLIDTTVSTTTLTTVGIAAAPPDTFDRLDDALAQAPVYGEGGNEITAELEYLDAYIEGLAESSAWPKPEFDTSALGAELVLIELPPSALTSVPRIVPTVPIQDDIPATEQPLVAGARLSGTEHAATFFIGLRFKDGAVSPIWRLMYTPSYKQGTVFDDAFAMQQQRLHDQDLPHIILMIGGDDPPLAVIGGLPREASVVATTLGDGTMVWQRPISSMAIFVDQSPQCLPDGALRALTNLSC